MRALAPGPCSRQAPWDGPGRGSWLRFRTILLSSSNLRDGSVLTLPMAKARWMLGKRTWRPLTFAPEGPARPRLDRSPQRQASAAQEKHRWLQRGAPSPRRVPAVPHGNSFAWTAQPGVHLARRRGPTALVSLPDENMALEADRRDPRGESQGLARQRSWSVIDRARAVIWAHIGPWRLALAP
jgi:hypothetical protein